MQGLPSTLLAMGAGRDPLARPGGGCRAGQELGPWDWDKSLEQGTETGAWSQGPALREAAALASVALRGSAG